MSEAAEDAEDALALAAAELELLAVAELEAFEPPHPNSADESAREQTMVATAMAFFMIVSFLLHSIRPTHAREAGRATCPMHGCEDYTGMASRLPCEFDTPG